MDKARLYGWDETTNQQLQLKVDPDGNLVVSEMDALIAAIGNLVISLGIMPPASITNAMLAANAVTESKTLAKTFTHVSLSDTAGILGTQLDASANIAGSQLASAAGIVGGQLAAGVKGNQIGPIPIAYSTLVGGSHDVISAIPLGFIGSIVGVYGIVVTAAADANSGAGTLDFVLSASGQVEAAGTAPITLPVAHTNTLNQVIAQSGVPAVNNTFVAADTLKIHFTQTNAMTSDTGVIWVFIVTN
jgi:hypothetical protein